VTIETIIFDFGGVLYLTPDVKWMNRWKKILGLKDDPEIAAMLANPNESEVMDQICLGNLPEDTIWQMLAEKMNINPNIMKRLQNKATSKQMLNKPMVDLLTELQENYQTGILSNAGDQTRSLMEDAYGLDQLVEDIVISAEEGVIKPDPAIYQIALGRLNARAETTLFLDDYLPNVQAAQALGMTAVQFLDNDQARADIQAALAGED
jgi:epoxide hydrolase-like predicted phosphatase